MKLGYWVPEEERERERKRERHTYIIERYLELYFKIFVLLA